MERDTNLRDEPMGDLVKRLSEQTSTLVRQELRLAQIEMQEKGKRAGMGAGLFGGAGVVALYGVGVLLAGLVLLLATALEPWIAAMIVAAVLFVAAAILGLTGKKQVEQATPPQPEGAIESTQKDVERVKEAAKR
jgi:membrane protein